VIEVVSDVSYLVRYPDGTLELLVDAERPSGSEAPDDFF
jgi:hypothetical protein